jgi:hypothetical protein
VTYAIDFKHAECLRILLSNYGSNLLT